MTSLISFLKSTLLTVFLTMFCFCTNTNKQKDSQLPDTVIRAGTAKISGSIINLKLPEGEKKVVITVYVNNPVTAEESRYVTNLDENNRFSLEVPLESTTALCCFGVATETKLFLGSYIGLEQNKEMQMNIDFNNDGKEIEVKGGLNLTYDDMMNISSAYARFEDHHTWGDYYKMTPGEFAEHELTVSLKERTHFALDSLPLSDIIKKHLVNDFNLRFLKGRLFFYKEDSEKSYRMSEHENLLYTSYTAVEPDKSYYAFLRQFNLNDPQYLYCPHYSEFLQKFLTIAAFKIPLIKDTPIDKWLDEVKTTVKDVVGFNSGLFYDMLAANAYARQFNDQKELLTNKQVENIKNYYKNGNEEIAGILLKKNEEVKKIVEQNNDLKVNETPAVAKEKLMDQIIAKYKGSVVLVDFWTTWCGPCLNAMKDIKSLKAELKSKGVVFAYLSNSTSPRPLWEGKIRGIGGEHYYLSDSEWEYVMGKFNFKGIPSYLIYDKKGILEHKFTSYPGNDKMREMIEKEIR